MVATLSFMDSEDRSLKAPPTGADAKAAQAAAEEAQRLAEQAQVAALAAQTAASSAQQSATQAQGSADSFIEEAVAADLRLEKASQAVRTAAEKLIDHALKQ